MSNALNTLRNIPLDKVTVVKGFNTRKLPDNAADDVEIIGLAMDITQNGLLQPLRVVPKDDGNYDLIAGHRRLMAIQYANEVLNAGIKSVQSVVTREMTDEQRDAYILADRYSATLKPLEAAEALKRFMDRGMSQTEVAKRFSLTVAYAGDLKLLGNAPEAVQQAVKEDVIAATEAVRLVKEYGADGAEILAKDALEDNPATTLPAPSVEASGDSAIAAETGVPETGAGATPVITKKRRGKAANDAVAKAKNVAPKRTKAPAREVPEGEVQSATDILIGTMIRIDRLIANLKIGNDEEVRRVHVELAYKLRDYLTAGHPLAYDGDKAEALSGIGVNTPDQEIEFMGEPQKDAA